jgi:hypothetical protein
MEASTTFLAYHETPNRELGLKPRGQGRVRASTLGTEAHDGLPNALLCSGVGAAGDRRGVAAL